VHISIGWYFFLLFPSQSRYFVFIPLIVLQGRKPVDQSLILYAVWRSFTKMKQGDSNPSLAFVGSGPQNNMDGALVSVSEFEPRALFQGCTCTGFGLAI
jgi:hypothetical protein